MNSPTIVTPYILDQPRAGYEPYVQPNWRINQLPTSSGLPALPGESPTERIAHLYQPIAEFVAERVSAGEPTNSFAGDCCAALGVLAGLQRAGIKPTLIWLDAHGDFNTWETTPSGFLGGMPLAWMAGLGEMTVMDGLGITPLMPDQIILSDGRDLDPGEKILIEGSGITHLPQIEALLDYPLSDAPLWVHFDVDLIDSNELKALSYPAPGGPTSRQLRPIFQRIAATGNVAAVSMSSWTPELDDDAGSGAAICLELWEILTS